MKKTLVLDDQLFRRAKREAGESKISLIELVNTALRKHFFAERGQKAENTAFTMPVFGESDSLHQTPVELAVLRDEGR